MTRLRAILLVGPINLWAVLVFLALGNLFVLVAAKAGVFNYLTLENPITYAVLLIGNLIGLAGWPRNWVQIDYVDDRNQPGRAYFTAASFLERCTSGPKRVFALLQAELQESEC